MSDRKPNTRRCASLLATLLGCRMLSGALRSSWIGHAVGNHQHRLIRVTQRTKLRLQLCKSPILLSNLSDLTHICLMEPFGSFDYP